MPWLSNIPEYVGGRDVVLVCPSPHRDLRSIKGKIIVSVKYYVPGATVIYSALTGNSDESAIKEFLKGGVEFIRCPHPKNAYCKRKPNYVDKRLKEFRARLKDRIPFDTVDRKCHKAWSVLVNSRPYSGVATVLDLLAMKPKSLYITGMTFYLDGTTKRMKWQLKKGIHDVEANRQLIRRIVNTNPAVSVCDYTARALMPEHITDYIKEIKRWAEFS